MADGGWIYGYYTMLPHNGTQAQEQAAYAGLEAALATMANWSVLQTQQVYNSRCLWFALQHTGGARLVFAYAGDSSSGNVIDGSNDAYGTVRAATNYEDMLWVAYVPPSFSATALGTDPGTASFLPANSLPFYPVSGTNGYSPERATTSGYRHDFHWVYRGNGIVFMQAIDSNNNGGEISRFVMMGECLEGLRHAAHPTYPDTGPNAKYAAVTMDGLDVGVAPRLSFYRAHDGGRSNPTVWAGASHPTAVQGVAAVAPWPWITPIVYITHADLDTYGIVPGNGVKGHVNSEWLRFLQEDGGPINDKQRLNGGDFIMLRNGIVIGWDVSNGGMR